MRLPGQYIDPDPPASLAAALAGSDAALAFCLEVTCGIPMTAWFPLGGVGYMHPLGDFSGQLNDSVDIITGVKVNGTALTEAANRNEVNTTTGRWYWDGVENQALLISMPDGSDPKARGVTVEAFATYRFSDGPTDAGGHRWRPWLVSPGSLTRQVTPDFSSLSQIGNGAFTFQNESHWFDERRTNNWDAGRCTLYVVPVDTALSLTTVATYVVSSAKLTDSEFTLNVQDPKVLADISFPAETYDAITYPQMDARQVGKAIPVAYGLILDAVPVCIDISAARFKVAGHAIHGFQAVRIRDTTTELWVVKDFASQNLATGEFTLSSVDWSFGAEVLVDFEGKPNSDGFLMENPADIAKDLLDELGLPTYDAGFTAAKARYDAGYYGNNPLDRATVMAPSLYLDSQGKALSVLEGMCANVRAYIQTMPDGSLTMTPFRCQPVAALPVLTDNNAEEPGIVVDGGGTSSKYVRAGSKVSQAQVKYAQRQVQGFYSMETAENLANLYRRDGIQPVVAMVDSCFTRERDATYLAQTLVNEYRVDPTFWTIKLKWLPWTWMPGQQVRAFFPRHCIDQVLEVLKISLNVPARECTLTLGNLRGWELSSGFWAMSTDQTPAGNGLDWPQGVDGGEANAGDSRDIRYNRLQAAHWHNSQDFAVDSTVLTNAYSDLDKAISRWQ